MRWHWNLTRIRARDVATTRARGVALVPSLEGHRQRNIILKKIKIHMKEACVTSAENSLISCRFNVMASDASNGREAV